jgi:hypothetical protein
MINTEELLKGLMTLIEKCTTLESKENKVQSEVEVPIVKSAISTEKRALFLVLEPSEDDGTTTDLHGDWYDEDTIRKACHDYNQRCERIGIMHKSIASDEDVMVQESYTAPCDFVTETGIPIKKGSWLMWLHFPSDDMWAKVEDGTYDSVSIECSAMGYEID